MPVYSTYEEAVAVRELARSQNWQSLLIVTSPTHTRRSRMIFRHIFADTGIDVYIRPVTEDWYDPKDWWQNRYQRRQVFLEYLKIAGFLVGFQ
jgi:uncharacterized SAM-binding protein YcdF (DUF218 family)